MPSQLSRNLHVSSSTGLSMFEVCYGFQLRMFEHQEAEVDVLSGQQMVGRLFHVGDRFWLPTKHVQLYTESKKLTPLHWPTQDNLPD